MSIIEPAPLIKDGIVITPVILAILPTEKADYFVGYDREYSVTEYIRDLGKIFRNVSGEECWGRFLIWCYTDCLMEYIQTERNRYPEVVALMEEQLKVMYRKTDKEKDVFWKAWRKNVNSIWK